MSSFCFVLASADVALRTLVSNVPPDFAPADVPIGGANDWLKSEVRECLATGAEDDLVLLAEGPLPAEDGLVLVLDCLATLNVDCRARDMEEGLATDVGDFLTTGLDGGLVTVVECTLATFVEDDLSSCVMGGFSTCVVVELSKVLVGCLAKVLVAGLSTVVVDPLSAVLACSPLADVDTSNLLLQFLSLT